MDRVSTQWAVVVSLVVNCAVALAQPISVTGPESSSGTVSATPTPWPSATPTIPTAVDCLSRAGYQWDYKSNSCKECIYSLSVFRSNFIKFNHTGKWYGDPNYQHPDDQKATLDRDDVVASFDLTGGSRGVRSPFIDAMDRKFTTWLDYCYNPMDVNSSQCATYEAYNEFSISDPNKNWAAPIDPAWSFDMVNPGDWWFGKIKKVWMPDANGKLVRVNTPGGITLGYTHEYGTSFFDKDGNRIDPRTIVDPNQDTSRYSKEHRPQLLAGLDKILCHHWDVQGVASPISLLLPNCDYRELEPTIAKFPLDPSMPDGFAVWKASSCMPLLALDPAGTGKITSARQLIGEWTNGGSTDADGKKTKWRHGFEALGFFDKDQDGVVSGTELPALVAWSDANRNGISEPGEVVSLASLGVSELRYRNPNPMRNGDLFIENGYLLSIDGKESKGLLIDWYGEVASSKTLLKGILPRNAVPSASSPTVKEKVACDKDSATIAGGWRWWLANDKTRTTRGFLTLSESRKNVFAGMTYSILPAYKKGTPLAGILNIWPLNAEQQGSTAKFSIPTQLGGTISDVELLENGKALSGTTVARSGLGQSMTYTWQAERVGCGDGKT
jgi:hypothetical protein